MIKSPTIAIYPLMNTQNGCEGNLNEERGGEILSGSARQEISVLCSIWKEDDFCACFRTLAGPLWCL